MVASCAARSCVVTRGALVRQRQQRDELHARRDKRRGALHEFGFDAALEQIADQHEDRLVRGTNQRWQYATARLMSVPPPSRVENSRSIGSSSSSVRSTMAVSNTTSEVRDSRQRREHRAEDRRVHHARRHRSALVDAQDHVAHRLRRRPKPMRVSGNDGLVVRLDSA